MRTAPLSKKPMAVPLLVGRISRKAQSAICRSPARRITLRQSALHLCRLADLVLRFGLEIAGVVTFVQLARRVAPGAVDHAPTLHRRALRDGVSPALHILVVLHRE